MLGKRWLDGTLRKLSAQPKYGQNGTARRAIPLIRRMSECEVEVQYPPPPPNGYLSDTCAIPYENKANGCDTPSAILSRKGIARYGGVSRIGLLSSAGHRPVLPFLGLSVFPGKSPKLARILFPCRTHKNTGKQEKNTIYHRLRCIQYRAGVWKCHRSLSPNSSPSTG